MQGANGPLHVALEVKQDEVYKAPPVKVRRTVFLTFKTFGGSANTLGSSPVVESRHVGGTVAPIIVGGWASVRSEKDRYNCDSFLGFI